MMFRDRTEAGRASRQSCTFDVPFQPELGMGAIGEDGVRVTNTDVVRLTHVSDGELAQVEARERAELA